MFAVSEAAPAMRRYVIRRPVGDSFLAIVANSLDSVLFPWFGHLQWIERIVELFVRHHFAFAAELANRFARLESFFGELGSFFVADLRGERRYHHERLFD